jgi:hypothetical protein
MGASFQSSEKPTQLHRAVLVSGAPADGQVSQLALCRIAQLQEEVLALRKALLKAERASALKQQLLRNALRRELELRAQMVNGMF